MLRWRSTASSERLRVSRESSAANIIPIATAAPLASTAASGDQGPEAHGDPFLRSVNETIGYHIAALDGAIGHVEDFLVDDEAWAIRYLVIDTRNWLPGKKVIVAPSCIHAVSGEKRQVTVGLSRDTIKASPPYAPTMPWSEDYGTQVHEYYERSRESLHPHRN